MIGNLVTVPALITVSVLLIIACVTDIWKLRIPNQISIAIIGLFFLSAIAQHMPIIEMLRHVGAAAEVFGVLFVLYMMRARIGGGDVKLVTAVALWAGMDQLEFLLLAVAFCGGGVAAVSIALRYFNVAPWIAAKWTHIACLDGSDLPYAVAIAGGFFVMQWSPMLG